MSNKSECAYLVNELIRHLQDNKTDGISCSEEEIAFFADHLPNFVQRHPRLFSFPTSRSSIAPPSDIELEKPHVKNASSAPLAAVSDTGSHPFKKTIHPPRSTPSSPSFPSSSLPTSTTLPASAPASFSLEKRAVSMEKKKLVSPSPKENTQTQNKTAESDFIKLEKPEMQEESFEEMERVIKMIAKDLPILEILPDDSEAKKAAKEWQWKTKIAPITILSKNESEPHQFFLQDLAKALEIYLDIPTVLIDAKILEEKTHWQDFLKTEELTYIIATDATLLDLPELKIHYREIPQKQQVFLGEKPFFMLPDLSLYMKEPKLKKSLWSALLPKFSPEKVT